MDKTTLILRLKLVIDQLDRAHEIALSRAAIMGIDPFSLMTPNGELVLTPIFVAQAHALSALAQLQANG